MILNGLYTLVSTECQDANPNIALVNNILNLGIDINFVTNGQSNIAYPAALPAAATNGHTELVKLLLDRGADIEIRCPIFMGASSLMVAALNGHPDTVNLLIARKANVNAKNLMGLTPLKLARQGALGVMHPLPPLLRH